MNDEVNHSEGNESQEIVSREEALLGIFSEENLHCHDLRKMNSALTRCFNALQIEVQTDAKQLTAVSPRLLQAIGAYLRGQEIRNAEGTLVADLDALSKDILQKIKKGVYEIAESKQIDGNLRAAVVDKKGKIIKQITLKHAEGNKVVAGDLNTMAIQAALRQITQQLDCIDAGIKYMITLKRRSDFQTPYFVAVKMVYEARHARNIEERNERIQRAIDKLNEGLEGLYGDLEDCLEVLKGQWIPIASTRNLNYISEDIVYIPQYVALLSYLYNCQGNADLARDTILYYREELNIFISRQIKDGYTAAQLVHSNYHYLKKNQNFWIDGMNRIQAQLNGLKLLPTADGASGKPVYYLSFDEVQEEEDHG